MVEFRKAILATHSNAAMGRLLWWSSFPTHQHCIGAVVAVPLHGAVKKCGKELPRTGNHSLKTSGKWCFSLPSLVP